MIGSSGIGQNNTGKASFIIGLVFCFFKNFLSLNELMSGEVKKKKSKLRFCVLSLESQI